VVQYIGTIPEIAEGWFVGVKFDEPVGRGDGTVRDRVLIDNCPPGYGGFIRARKVYKNLHFFNSLSFWK